MTSRGRFQTRIVVARLSTRPAAVNKKRRNHTRARSSWDAQMAMNRLPAAFQDDQAGEPDPVVATETSGCVRSHRRLRQVVRHSHFTLPAAGSGATVGPPPKGKKVSQLVDHTRLAFPGGFQGGEAGRLA